MQCSSRVVSAGGEAAVDNQAVPCDEGRPAGTQPQNGVGHLFDPTDTPDGMQGTSSSLLEPRALVNRSTISVSITAGLTALMRIPCADTPKRPFSLGRSPRV